MLLTTTPTIQGKEIKAYKNLVIGETVIGINLIKDFFAAFTDIFGGRSDSYESSIVEARNIAIREMMDKAKQAGANAVVGVDIDYESIGAKGKGMILVTVSGTAVIVEE